MTIQKLFESLDETVFTAELKESMQTQFNEAVEIRACLIADERIEEELDRLETKASEYSEMLEAKTEEYAEYVREETLEKVSQYMDLVVEEFVKEAEEALEESAKSEKADMLIEAFDSMLKATGTDFANIVESRVHDDELTEASNARIDRLVEELAETKAENEELIRMGIVAEMCEGLSLLESAKFKRLSNMVEFSKSSAYTEKLGTILESVKGSKQEGQEPLNESKDSAQVWTHLV